MVGNPSSASSITLSTLALHATILSSSYHNVVAEDASAAIENLSTGSRSHQQKHLRHKRRRLCETSKHGWHPWIGSEGCSNSNNYPPEWETVPGLIGKMFHDSAAGCCGIVHKSDGNCPVEDVCDASVEFIPGQNPTPPPPPPADAPKPPGPSPSTSSGSSGGTCVWHIEMDRQDGCTNDDK